MLGFNEERLVNGIVVDKNPTSRDFYLKELLHRDGLMDIEEIPNEAYCALSLTSTPDDLKPAIRQRQNRIKAILAAAGIEGYDPGSAPTSPDLELQTGPDVIYRIDKSRIARARFFVANDVLPSTGVGVEIEAARTYNRMAVVLHDTQIRTSRMQPNRIIHLGYSDLEEQEEDLIKVFRLLQQFQPGMGLQDGVPVLLGFREGSKPMNLEKLVYSTFPHLKYEYEGTVPLAKLAVTNPGVFRELRN